MKKNFLGLFLAGFFLLCPSIPVEASLIGQFTATDADLGQGLAGGTISGTVDIAVKADDHVANFKVGLDESVLTPQSDLVFGITKFCFNFHGLDLAKSNIQGLPPGFGVKVGEKEASGFGRFDVEVKVDKGNAPANPLAFVVENESILSEHQFYVPNSVGYHFAAEIVKFSLNDTAVNEVSFGNGDPRPSTVPEHATMLLLGAGLIGLAGVTRKKFFKKAQDIKRIRGQRSGMFWPFVLPCFWIDQKRRG